MKSARVAWGLTLGLLLIAGCSVGLDWDPDGLPCSESGTCEVGYSCFLPPGDYPSSDLSELRRCVEDASIERGELLYQ